MKRASTISVVGKEGGQSSLTGDVIELKAGYMKIYKKSAATSCCLSIDVTNVQTVLKSQVLSMEEVGTSTKFCCCSPVKNRTLLLRLRGLEDHRKSQGWFAKRENHILLTVDPEYDVKVLHDYIYGCTELDVERAHRLCHLTEMGLVTETSDANFWIPPNSFAIEPRSSARSSLARPVDLE